MRSLVIRTLTVATLGSLPFAAGEAHAFRPCPTPLSPDAHSYLVFKAGGYGMDTLDPRDELDSGLFLGTEIGVSPSPFVEVGMTLDWFRRRDRHDDRIAVDSPYDLPIQGRVDVDGTSTDLIPFGGIVRLRFPLGDGRLAPYVSGQLTYDILRLRYHEVFREGDGALVTEATDYFYGPGGSVALGMEARLDPRFALLFEVGAHGSEPAKDLVVDGIPVRGHVVADGEFARLGMRLAFF